MKNISYDLYTRERIVGQIFCLITISLVMLACSPVKENGKALPEILRVGILPDESPERIHERYSELLGYLTAELGVPSELIYSTSYEDLVARFGHGDVDLAYFGGVTFVQAKLGFGALPVVTRDIDQRFTSYVLVRAPSEADGLADLQGLRFALGSQSSTSGHFMPRYYLEQQGMRLEEFFESVEYSGAHDKTVEWILEGRVDAGAVNSSLVDMMYRNGELDPDKVRVLWESPPYFNYVWAMPDSYSNGSVNKVRDAFLALSKRHERHAKVLDSMGASYFLPVSTDNYRVLTRMVEQFSSREAP